MKPISIFIFCVTSLISFVAVAYTLYPHARLSDEVVLNSATPKAMEDFDQLIDLGDDYGQLSLFELMGFYMDNPPASETQSTQAAPTRQFGGC
jgi:hypothetical protein